jgi:hypothetical protein
MRGRARRVRRGAPGGRFCLGIVVTIGTAACAPPPDEARFTVDYYRQHREAREAKLAACINDPGELGPTPDCVNARQAARLEGAGSLRDLPALGLPDAGAERRKP